jgi:hypothetical protein
VSSLRHGSTAWRLLLELSAADDRGIVAKDLCHALGLEPEEFQKAMNSLYYLPDYVAKVYDFSLPGQEGDGWRITWQGRDALARCADEPAERKRWWRAK